MAAITQANFDYLNKLKQNNDREWFTKHKDLYLEQHQSMIEFADDDLN